MIEVAGQNLDIDVREELEDFLDQFKKMKIRDNKIQSCSPFRIEKTPSFAVNLTNGSWIDSGATEEQYRKGHFIELLAFLMGVTLDEAEAYLVSKYGLILKDLDNLQLNLNLSLGEVEKKVFQLEELKQYMFRHPYLTNRGISEKTQRAFKIGYDMDNKAVMIPWMDKKGQIVNVKFRSIENKRFFYIKGGQRIKDHLFGLNFIYKLNCKEVVIVESETDCMYLWSMGIPAIACGTASLSEAQSDLLKQSPIESIILGTDNDVAGIRFKDFLKKHLTGSMKVFDIKIPDQYKDINDMPPTVVKKVIADKKEVGLTFQLNMSLNRRTL